MYRHQNRSRNIDCVHINERRTMPRINEFTQVTGSASDRQYICYCLFISLSWLYYIRIKQTFFLEIHSKTTRLQRCPTGIDGLCRRRKINIITALRSPSRPGKILLRYESWPESIFIIFESLYFYPHAHEPRSVCFVSFSSSVFVYGISRSPHFYPAQDCLTAR